MKRNILIILIIMLFTTGCTCEYNLIIEDNKYQENIKIIAENNQEISDINYNWKISTDKEEYNLVGDYDTNKNYQNDLYDYKINNNILTFNYTFFKSKYINSSAVSECYDRLNVSKYKNAIIISTSIKVLCFDKYPNLNEIKVNIKTDKEVISSNSDKFSNGTYTWYINKENYTNKSINLTLSNESKIEEQEKASNEESNINKETTIKTQDYGIYIFFGILLLIMLITYFWFNKIKNKNNGMDD